MDKEAWVSFFQVQIKILNIEAPAQVLELSAWLQRLTTTETSSKTPFLTLWSHCLTSFYFYKIIDFIAKRDLKDQVQNPCIITGEETETSEFKWLDQYSQVGKGAWIKSMFCVSLSSLLNVFSSHLWFSSHFELYLIFILMPCFICIGAVQWELQFLFCF